MKKLRFRKHQIEQKILDLQYREIQLGEQLCTNLKFDSNARKKTKFKKVPIDKNVIYYGDGNFKHNSFGCESVMNKKLIYSLSKRTLVLMTPEFKTSVLCSECHSNNGNWNQVSNLKSKL